MTALLIGKPLSHYTAETWLTYVAGLRKLKPSNASKSVPEITIHWNARVLLKLNRPSRAVTEAELAMLALEYGKEISELSELFTKRKVRILNEEGEQTNAKPKRTKSGRPRKAGSKTAKANARGATGGADDKGSDKLLESGSDRNLSSQDALLAEPQAAS